MAKISHHFFRKKKELQKSSNFIFQDKNKIIVIIHHLQPVPLPVSNFISVYYVLSTLSKQLLSYQRSFYWDFNNQIWESQIEIFDKNRKVGPWQLERGAFQKSTSLYETILQHNRTHSKVFFLVG